MPSSAHRYPPISPGSGYQRLDIRPSPRLQEAMKVWLSRQIRPMPLARAARTLIWLGLQAAGVETPRASKALIRRANDPVWTEGWDEIREDPR
jgi:hypothetical protein